LALEEAAVHESARLFSEPWARGNNDSGIGGGEGIARGDTEIISDGGAGDCGRLGTIVVWGTIVHPRVENGTIGDGEAVWNISVAVVGSVERPIGREGRILMTPTGLGTRTGVDAAEDRGTSPRAANKSTDLRLSYSVMCVRTLINAWVSGWTGMGNASQRSQISKSGHDGWIHL